MMMMMMISTSIVFNIYLFIYLFIYLLVLLIREPTVPLRSLPYGYIQNNTPSYSIRFKKKYKLVC